MRMDEMQQVVATQHRELWFIECGLCGPLALAEEHLVERVAQEHMAQH